MSDNAVLPTTSPTSLAKVTASLTSDELTIVRNTFEALGVTDITPEQEKRTTAATGRIRTEKGKGWENLSNALKAGELTGFSPTVDIAGIQDETRLAYAKAVFGANLLKTQEAVAIAAIRALIASGEKIGTGRNQRTAVEIGRLFENVTDTEEGRKYTRTSAFKTRWSRWTNAARMQEAGLQAVRDKVDGAYEPTVKQVMSVQTSNLLGTDEALERIRTGVKLPEVTSGSKTLENGQTVSSWADVVNAASRLSDALRTVTTESPNKAQMERLGTVFANIAEALKGTGTVTITINRGNGRKRPTTVVVDKTDDSDKSDEATAS